MPAAPETSRPLEIGIDLTPVEACRRMRRPGSCSALLDGSGGFHEAWLDGPLVAIDARPVLELRRSAGGPDARVALGELARLLDERRRTSASPDTGLLALCGFELFLELPGSAAETTGPAAEPDLLVLAVDRSLRFPQAGRPRLTTPNRADLDVLHERLAHPAPAAAPARAVGAPRTSLPRPHYERAVAEILEHIACGDVYQANLCQRFDVAVAGDPYELYARLAGSSPAPHSAFVETPGLALISASPETFLRMRDATRIETWPIKGTRARGATAEADREAARELERSAKDAAELLMIVDLERNDLSRVCRAGSVRVRDLGALRSYAHVHHLVAGIEGELRGGVDVAEILGATFPGGSISGAPKTRAIQILRGLEPAPRGLFTGSLLWLPDSGQLDSSILIRTIVIAGDRAWLGAGGGIVADSDPRAEWLESNHKARALARELGFDPEEAR